MSLSRDMFERLSKAYTLIVGSDFGLVRRSHEENVAAIYTELQNDYYRDNIAVLNNETERALEFTSANLKVGQVVFLRNILSFTEWNGTAWITVLSPPSPGLVDPTTTTGDLIVRGSSGLIRLPAGSEQQVLTIVGGVPAWQLVDAYTKAQADARFAPIGLVAIVAGLTPGVTPARSLVSWTTPVITYGSAYSGVVNVGAGDSDLLDIVASVPCWIRFYGSVDDQTADAARLVTADPTTPVLAEFVLAADVPVLCDPFPKLIQRGVTQSETIFYTIVNNSISSVATIDDSFSTAGAGLLTAYAPPGASNYTGFTTPGGANDWATVPGQVKVPTSHAADVPARINEVVNDRALLFKMAVRRGGATAFYNSIGATIWQPDAGVDPNNHYGLGVFSGNFPSGATLACQIVQFQTPGSGRVIKASGAPFTLAPGLAFFLQGLLSNDGTSILLQSSTVGLTGPWTDECSYVLSGAEQTFFLDGAHRHVGLLGTTADFAGTEWLVEHMTFQSTQGSSIVVSLNRVRIEP